MADHMRTDLIRDAITGAAATTNLSPGAVFHSDAAPRRIQPVVATPRTGGGEVGRPAGWSHRVTGRPSVRSPARPGVARREVLTVPPVRGAHVGPYLVSRGNGGAGLAVFASSGALSLAAPSGMKGVNSSAAARQAASRASMTSSNLSAA